MNKVSVCHISNTRKRNNGRFRKECETLANSGYDVTLLLSKDMEEDEIINKVKVRSIRFNKTGKLAKIFKLQNELYKEALKIDSDIYQIHDVTLLPVGTKLKKQGKKVIMDYNEDYEALMKKHPWIPKSLQSIFGKIYSLYEKNALKKMDSILSVTPHITKRLSEINKNTMEINNFPFIEKKIINDYTKENICFAGSISSVYMHKNIIQAIEPFSKVTYHIAGITDPNYYDMLTQLPGWRKVKYYGVVSFDKIKNIYSDSSIGVVIHEYHPNTDWKRGTLGNNKLFEYMMMGLPVVCTDFTLWKEIIDEWQCGIYVNPYNISEIQNAIKKILTTPGLAKLMGQNGRKAALEKYNWDNNLANKYLDVYRKLSRLSRY